MNFQIIFSYAGHYEKNLPVPHHSHRGTELVYVSAGKCITKFSDGTSLFAEKGTVYVTPPEVAHIQENLTDDCETFYCVMEFFGGEPDTRLRTINTAGDVLLEQWFRHLFELSNNYAPEQASALLHAVWLRLDQLEKQQHRQMNHHEGVRRAVEFLERHYMEECSIVELARKVGVSQSYLNALFRAEFGSGAGDYLTTLRMKHARQLLLNPYYNIAEVAEKCGLPNPNYFIRRFRSFHGVTPGEYRKNPTEYADPIRVVS